MEINLKKSDIMRFIEFIESNTFIKVVLNQ